MTEDTQQTPESPQSDIQRIFRREVMISDADLRVEVANEISRTISGDEVINLDEKNIDVGGDATISRTGRDRTVTGEYKKRVTGQEMLSIGTSVQEEVRGLVKINARQEAEAIIGGAYTGTHIGALLRITGLSDFLCWGGYLEADVIRIEIAAMQIRAYVTYAHAVGAKVSVHSRYIDDEAVRVPNVGVDNDNTTTVQTVGVPGSVIAMEN